MKRLKFIEELINEILFTSLGRARKKIDAWIDTYNYDHPHSSFGYAEPAAFVDKLKKQGAASLRTAISDATLYLTCPRGQHQRRSSNHNFIKVEDYVNYPPNHQQNLIMIWRSML